MADCPETLCNNMIPKGPKERANDLTQYEREGSMCSKWYHGLLKYSWFWKSRNNCFYTYPLLDKTIGILDCGKEIIALLHVFSRHHTYKIN